MTVALSVFHPWVSLACPMVPNPVMDDAIRRAAREFCKQTEALVEDVTLVMVQGVQDYSPTLAVGTELVSVRNVKRAATETLVASTQDKLAQQTAATGKPRNYAVLETHPLSLRMYPTPEAAENLSARFHVMPTTTASVVDDRLGDWYLEGVVAYAKYWLMIQPGQPWTNPDTAAFSHGQFETKVSETVVKLNQSRSGIPSRVEMRPFA